MNTPKDFTKLLSHPVYWVDMLKNILTYSIENFEFLITVS